MKNIVSRYIRMPGERKPTWYLNYNDQQDDQSKSPLEGDHLLNLSDRSIYAYLPTGETNLSEEEAEAVYGATGITDATGPVYGWVDTSETMEFTNHGTLTSALEKVPTCATNGSQRVLIHLYDTSTFYNGYPTTFAINTDGTTGSSAYDVASIEQEIRKTLWRPQKYNNFTLFQPETKQDYTLLVGPLENGHQDGQSYIPVNYNF